MNQTISIHALRKESDGNRRRRPALHAGFQSTLSARRATIWVLKKAHLLIDFNPRSPQGERHVEEIKLTTRALISIHALRKESDGTTGGAR